MDAVISTNVGDYQVANLFRFYSAVLLSGDCEQCSLSLGPYINYADESLQGMLSSLYFHKWKIEINIKQNELWNKI